MNSEIKAVNIGPVTRLLYCIKDLAYPLGYPTRILSWPLHRFFFAHLLWHRVRMESQQPWRRAIPQTSYVPAMTLQQQSQALAPHKYFILVRRSLIYPHFRVILMRDQAEPEFLLDISHFVSSSSQASTCSVEPGSAEDVSKIVSHLNLINLHLPTHILIATYSGIKPNSLCRERWRTHL